MPSQPSSPASTIATGRHYEFGPFRLDSGGGMLLRQGERLALTPKSVEILSLLVEAQGNPITKEELLQRVWPDTFVEEGSLTSHISILRKSLGKGPAGQQFIETIPKRGYRFAVPVSIVENGKTETTAPPLRKRMAPWKLAGLACAGFAIGAALYVGLRDRIRGNTASVPAIQSLAVLPLENLSRDPEQEYFADGMTEELTTELAQISALKVISHTSVVPYKETKKSLPQIARELGVDAVIEGAVERSGDKVGITVQLIEARSDRHLWAKSYERGLRDVLELQREVTHAIVDEIKAKLTVPEKAHLASTQSIDSRAYEYYLKGHFSLEKGDLRQSIAYFQQAIQEEPNYALAYAGLANSYIFLGQPWGGDLSPREVLPQARAAALRALEIDDSLGDAHLALARVVQLYDWNWPTVEKEYRRALELNQNDALAHAEFGEYLQETGRNDEAMVECRRAAALDPLNSGLAAELGFVFYTARQYDPAIREFQKALELDFDKVDTHVGLGWVYEKKKMYLEAIEELQKAVKLSNRHEVPLASLGKVLGESGGRPEAKKILEELKLRSGHRYVSPCLLALVQTGLGERDEAIASLEQGYTNRDQWMLYLKVDPHMDDLRSDPRFQDLVRRVGIPN